MAASISSVAPLKFSAPIAAAGVREYDPEIKDMASYVHNYKIDSDLAVSSIFLVTLRRALNILIACLPPSLILLDTSSLIPLGVDLKLFGSRNVRNYLALSSKEQLFLTAQGYQGHLLCWIP